MSKIALALGELEKELNSGQTKLTNPLQKLAVKESDQRERRRQAQEQLDDRMDENIEEKTEYLADYICRAWEAAKSARTAAGIDEQITEGRRMMRGEYSCEELATIQADDGIDTWYHLMLSMKTVYVAFVRSVLTPDDENRIWSIKASKIPDLPEEDIRREAEFLALELEQEFLEAVPIYDEFGNEIPPITAEQLIERTEEWRETMYQKLDALAERKTRNLERKVETTLEVGDFDKAIDNAVNDMACDPIACIHPFISSKKQPEWKNGRKVWVERQYIAFKNLDVDRLWPSEDSTNANDGTWIFYLDKHNKTYFSKAKKMKGFVPENIDIMLKTFENSCRAWTNPLEAEMEALEDRVYPSWRQEEQIDVLKAHGSIPGEVLIRAGVDRYCGKKIDVLDCYEYEVWLVDKHIIRAVERVYEGSRPFFCVSMYPTCGSFYGKGLAQMLKDPQRKANMYDRSEIRDVSYTSAPYFETDIGLIDVKTGKVPKQMKPGMNVIKNSRQNPRGGNAITPHRIESQAQYFNVMKNNTFSEAELITGINRQLLGQAQPGVSTWGESRQLQENAATGLKSILSEIDCQLIEPIIEMVMCLIMMTTDDPELKADARAKAYGSTNLLSRELNKNSFLQLFNTLLPMYQNGQPGVMEPEGMACLLREIIKSFGSNPDKFVVDPLSAKARRIELEQAQIQAGSTGGGSPGGVNQPPGVQPVAAGLSPAQPGAAV